jgi:hypothetical protein
MVSLAKKDYPGSENNVDPQTHPVDPETISAPQMNILVQKLHGRFLRHSLLSVSLKNPGSWYNLF